MSFAPSRIPGPDDSVGHPDVADELQPRPVPLPELMSEPLTGLPVPMP